MFEDSLVESSGRIKTGTRWTTSISFLVQIAALGILVLIPLIYTEALPRQALSTFLVAPPPPPPPPPPPAPVKAVKMVSELDQGALRTPTKIPDKIKMVKEEEAPPPSSGGVAGGVAGGMPGGALGGVIGGIVGNAPPPKVVAAKVEKQRISGGVAAGNLITKVTPVYPPIAKTARIQGTVVLAATISKTGTITNLHLVSGPPMLVNAAMDAVRQWRYKPFLLSGEPTEVETTIQVNFTMNGAG